MGSMRRILGFALALCFASTLFGEEPPPADAADTFIACGALYEIMAELELAEGRSISARDLRVLGRQAQAAAGIVLREQDAFAAAGDVRNEEEIAEYIATRREDAIERFLAVLEALDNESFEASAEHCMGTIDAQKAVIEQSGG
jgi:hypothetical protein